MNEENIDELTKIKNVLTARFDEINLAMDRTNNIRILYDLKIARDELKTIYNLITEGKEN